MQSVNGHTIQRLTLISHTLFIRGIDGCTFGHWCFFCLLASTRTMALAVVDWHINFGICIDVSARVSVCVDVVVCDEGHAVFSTTADCRVVGSVVVGENTFSSTSIGCEFFNVLFDSLRG